MKHFIVNGREFEVTERDISLMFGDQDGIIDPDDEIVPIETDDLAALAFEADVFPSRGQARKNGLGGAVPHGLFLFGTKKKRFWVWNPIPPTSQPTFDPTMEHTDRWFLRGCRG